MLFASVRVPLVKLVEPLPYESEIGCMGREWMTLIMHAGVVMDQRPDPLTQEI